MIDNSALHVHVTKHSLVATDKVHAGKKSIEPIYTFGIARSKTVM